MRGNWPWSCVYGPGPFLEGEITAYTISHFANLFDIHMMCWGSARERTEREHAQLMHCTGWKFVAVHYPDNKLIGLVEGGFHA